MSVGESSMSLPQLQRAARDHLWMHFTRMGSYASADVPVIVRGAGFFYSLELVKDKETRATFDADECEWLLRGFLSHRLLECGLICRADDRGDPVLQLSPPLVARQREFDEIVRILGEVLTEAWDKLRRR